MTYPIPDLLINPLLDQWLREDIGRGDRTTQALFKHNASRSHAEFRLKQTGVIAGLAIALRVFTRLDSDVEIQPLTPEGGQRDSDTIIARVSGPSDTLLMGERVALNLLMRLSGIATRTRTYAEAIKDLPTHLVDTRKTTPGLRLLEKYATYTGGALNHRFGLDDAMMLKENHIQAAGGIGEAIALVRQSAPYPLALEVETETLTEVESAVSHGADIIMLDNMSLAEMKEAIALIRAKAPQIKIEASGNITMETIRSVAETGVDFISTSATITQAPWLDISLRFVSLP
ncbi:MAG: carboxylating nicotinate-nucleotide diphosphorylase [Chloroflexota bacterium]